MWRLCLRLPRRPFLLTTRKSWAPAALTRFDRKFEVFEIRSTGQCRLTSITLADILRRWNVHARDIVSLGLQDERYKPPAVILPRGDLVVVALGHLKALLHADACMVFDASRPQVSHSVSVLSQLMEENAKPASCALDNWQKGEDEDPDPIRTMFREQEPIPFELAMLEAMLQDVCSSYHRRAHVVRRLMEQGLDGSNPTQRPALETYRLVPLKLALKQLDLTASQTRACLEDLMHNDEDMLGLLVTEKGQLGLGEDLEHDRHSVVELLLENYHRQLVLVEQNVAGLTQEVQSIQELAVISLDVSRNSLISLDIRLAMLNVGVAACACLFGAFGMNLINGLEDSASAFPWLVGGGVSAATLAFAGLSSQLGSTSLAEDTKREQLKALATMCHDIETIESTLHRTLWAQGPGHEEAVDRSALAASIESSRKAPVTDHELDLIFGIFDSDASGAIGVAEYTQAVAADGKGKP